MRVAAQSPCRTSQPEQVPLVEGVEVWRAGKEILLDGDERPFLYLSSPILKAAALAELFASRVPSVEFKLGPEGVIAIACGPAPSRGSFGEGKTVLGLAHLRRRCTKTTTPITAATPPKRPPAIAPMSRFLRDGILLGLTPLVFIVSTGALREVARNEKRRVNFARTSELMAQTQHLARD